MTRVIEFKDKVVVITGAGGVLCGYLAKEFAKAGAKVALLDLNEVAAQVFVDEIESVGGVAKTYKSNVLSKENLEEVRQQVLADFGVAKLLANHSPPRV
ncbi:D-mannonate oxidoreductase [Streptococcus pneumoniae]|nr:D-mannonate oxidoreductase [Streptococcus pneumoniae]